MLRITIEVHHISEGLMKQIHAELGPLADKIGAAVKKEGMKDNFAGSIRSEINPDNPTMARIVSIDLKNHLK